MTQCDTQKEDIRLIMKAEILKMLSNPAFQAVFQSIFCEMIANGELCVNLPAAIKVNDGTHQVSLITSAGYTLTAHLDCGCCKED